MTAPHLDDERLSAHLDGHEPSAAAHLGSCERCQARADSLRAAARAVAAPVPPADGSVREAAIAAALAAPASAGGDVVPLRPRRGMSRRPLALGAAALVLIVMVAVSVLGGGGDSRQMNAALDDESGRVTAGEAFAGASDGGDLGDQSDPQALAARLRAVLEPTSESAADAGTTASGSGGASGSGAAGGGATASPAPMAAEAKSQDQAARRGDTGGGPDCTATVAREYASGLGPLAYRASLRWEGTPAVVLVYPISGATGALDRRVLVMARSDCRLLVAQTI